MTVYRALDKGLTTPCDAPLWFPEDIRTDVDLMGLMRQYQAANDCNVKKLKTIDQLQGSQSGDQESRQARPALSLGAMKVVEQRQGESQAHTDQ